MFKDLAKLIPFPSTQQEAFAMSGADSIAMNSIIAETAKTYGKRQEKARHSPAKLNYKNTADENRQAASEAKNKAAETESRLQSQATYIGVIGAKGGTGASTISL